MSKRPAVVNEGTFLFVLGICCLIVGGGAGYIWGATQTPEVSRKLTSDERLFLALLERQVDLEIDDPDSMVFEIKFEGVEYWLILQKYEMYGRDRLGYVLWRVEK